MNSISKSKGSWAKTLLSVCLLALSTQVPAQDNVTQGSGGTAMHWQSRHPEVAHYEALYRKESAKIQLLMNRSAPAIRLIISQLQRRKLPLELVFVPLVESGYNPYAESPVGAMGPWQLMPSTARQYGVIRLDWFDGRKDLLASTRGALNYLSYLHSLFERDWLLALAAYNAGEGTVQGAMAQNSGKGRQADFWSLSLPQETRQYVPKLLALVRLYRAGHIQLPAVPEASRLVALHVEDGVSLAWLARKLGQSTDVLGYYNAGLENAVAPRGSRVALLLPAALSKRAHDVLGGRSQALPLPKEVVTTQAVARRALAEEELRALGWGVGLIQQTPGSMDLHSAQLAIAQQKPGEGEKSGKDQTGQTKKNASLAITPHWRPKIDPLSQWNPTGSGEAATP